MRTASKRDGNEPEIIAALQAAGCAVWRVNDPALPDLLICTPDGETVLLEVKARYGKLTPLQVRFFGEWPGRAVVVRSVSDALQAVDRLAQEIE